MSGSEDGVFHEAGYLRVDRERALEKLSQYSLPAPGQFLLPWARTAVASGAAHLDVSGGRDVELSFDGAPLLEADLRDPYSSLIVGGGEAPRQFALGLLACLAAGAELVEAEFGPPGARRRLSVRSVRDEALAAAGGTATRTLVHARFAAPGPAEEARRTLAKALAMAPPGFTVDGETAAQAPDLASGLWGSFSGEGRRGLLTVSPGPLSRLAFCSLGVEAAVYEEDLGTAPVRVWVDDPALSLNASQSAVVFNPAREAAARAAARACWAHADEHREKRAPPELRAWLQGMAARAARPGAGDDGPGPARERLLREPLWTDVHGKPASTTDLALEFSETDRMLWSARPDSRLGPALRVVHCPGGLGAPALSGLFGSKAVDVTSLLEDL